MIKNTPCICVVMMSALTLSASMAIRFERDTDLRRKGVEDDLSGWLRHQLLNRRSNRESDNLVTCDPEDHMCRLKKLERRLQRDENLLLELRDRISHWIAERREEEGSGGTSNDPDMVDSS
ncbi:unnamed protein product [Calicophoron daubneyi]|uniref:Uncharacterized protein n=1 Tax=Calicophoron daubneyi TaxID=300641 RepID=A0AAV2T1B2_CALDB